MKDKEALILAKEIFEETFSKTINVSRRPPQQEADLVGLLVIISDLIKRVEKLENNG